VTGKDTPFDDAIDDDTRAAARGRLDWLSITVAVLFGLFYAYDLWEAISNAVSLPQAFALYGFDTTDVPWVLLIVGIVIPPLVYGIAFAVGLRRNVFAKAVVFTVGLTVVAVLSLDLVAIQGRMFAALITS